MRTVARTKSQPSLRRSLVWQLVPNAILPIAAYLVLRELGVAVVLALVLTGVFPALAVIVSAIRSRKMNWFGVAMLGVIVVGSAVSLVSGDPHFVLAKESLITAGLGVAFLGSLVLSRPGVFYLMRTAALMNGPERAERWNRMWDGSAVFRAAMRRITVVFGLVCLVEAVVRVWLTFLLAPAVMLGVSQILPLVFLAVLFPWLFTTFNRAWRVGNNALGDDLVKPRRVER